MKTQMNKLSLERFGVHAVGMAACRMNIIFRELPTSDRGIDGQFELTDESGAGNGRLIALQVKSGISYFKETTPDYITFRFDEKHRHYWLEHSVPVIVIVCNPDDQKCYWEVVTEDTCKPAGQSWRIDIPWGNKLVCLTPLLDIASPIVSSSDFTIENEEDNSHNHARRISLNVSLNPTDKPWSKVRIASVIRRCVEKGRNSDYYRNEVVKDRFSDKPVDMVFGFVYLNKESLNAAQWCCRFQWRSSEVPEIALCKSVKGEFDNDGLAIEWRIDRNLVSLLNENRIGKGKFLEKLDKLMKNVPKLLNKIKEFNSTQFSVDKGIEISLLCEKFESDWTDDFVPPVECESLDQKAFELVCLVGNLVLILGENSTYSERDAISLTRNCVIDIEEKAIEIRVHRKDIQ